MAQQDVIIISSDDDSEAEATTSRKTRHAVKDAQRSLANCYVDERTHGKRKLAVDDYNSSNLHPPSPQRMKRDHSFSVAQYVTPPASTLEKEQDSDGMLKSKNGHLKGRRRFNADLQDVMKEAESDLVINGLLVGGFSSEDEGLFSFTIHGGRDEEIQVGFFISDISDYPGEHSFCASSESTRLSPRTSSILDGVATMPSATIQDTIQALTLKLASTSETVDVGSDDEEGNSDDDDAFFDYDDDDEQFSSAKPGSRVKYPFLQNDWNEIVASGYRPGFIKFTEDRFAVSVSYPVALISQLVPPSTLLAWDRRLLSKRQYLTLLITGFDGTYPPPLTATSTPLSFKVGLTGNYKPGIEATKRMLRKFGSLQEDAEDELERLRVQAELEARMNVDMESGDPDGEAVTEEPENETVEEEAVDELDDPDRFDRFSLSHSLETLMDSSFLKLIQLRKQFGLGWAGAEFLLLEMERHQTTALHMYNGLEKNIRAADVWERGLPKGPGFPRELDVSADHLNIPLIAFSYLLRRFTYCTRYCLVCHHWLDSKLEVLKPTVCDQKLCKYQYYCLNQGTSLEYQICHNTATVDLLLSLLYTSAVEGALSDPLPVGMNMRTRIPTYVPPPVPRSHPTMASVSQLQMPGTVQLHPDVDGLVEFDSMGIQQMRGAVVELIRTLPPIKTMKNFILKAIKVGKVKPTLQSMDPDILPAAWSLLRWCVASCTAHIEESGPEDRIRNLGDEWYQFKFSVGAPDAQTRFNAAVREGQAMNHNMMIYPSIYAFHGSATRNWHSIIRNGLWFKDIVNGRSYGNGVYLAREATTSMFTYSVSSSHFWANSAIQPTTCTALAEVVNRPSEFVSNSPYVVVKQTEWVMCRYLLVKGRRKAGQREKVTHTTPLVTLDPASPAWLPVRTPDTAASSSQSVPAPTPALAATTINPARLPKRGVLEIIQIPDPSFQVAHLMNIRMAELDHGSGESDAHDMAIFNWAPSLSSSQTNRTGGSKSEAIVLDDDDGMEDHSAGAVVEESDPDDWQHDPDWVQEGIKSLLPPPSESSPSSTMALQRELKSMLREQEKAKSMKELGWHLPTDLIGDNLFQWVIEMHSFDEELAIARDMRSNGVNSVIFEIIFPPTFPLSPPFFRILTPRFLPFIRGGGGHVTGGGSICMDLLTSDGWLPSYSISAILLQIKLAISNPDPRPARLAPGNEWRVHYGPQEALEGYRRAAATHQWTVPAGLEKLVLRR